MSFKVLDGVPRELLERIVDPHRRVPQAIHLHNADCLELRALLSEQPQASADKDVHTEHCCKAHGCKYNDPACTVAYGDKVQSFPCEDCREDAQPQASAAQSVPAGEREAYNAWHLETYKTTAIGGSDYRAFQAGAAWQRAQSAPVVPEGIVDRIEAALQRIENGHGLRRIPADPTDVDLVLAECRAVFEGKWPPIWIKAAAPAQPVAQEPVAWTSRAKLKAMNDMGVASMWPKRIADDNDVPLYTHAPAAHDQGEVQRLREALSTAERKLAVAAQFAPKIVRCICGEYHADGYVCRCGDDDSASTGQEVKP